MLPSGSAQLIFALHEAPMQCRPPGAEQSIAWSGSIVHGPQSSYYVAGPKPRGSVAGVSFRPGAAGALLGVPMEELVDRHVGLDALWGARAAELQQRLMRAAEPGAAGRRAGGPRAAESTDVFGVLEQALSARIHRPLLIHPAIAQALKSQPTPDVSSGGRVAEAQRASGYSPRHFIALFRTAVGLNPKLYQRIRRFGSAVQRMAGGRGLSEVAAATGYSDQAHLTREFRELAGVVPTRYRPGGIDRPLHHDAASRSERERR
jgi:AraC-like DNA-binding protein